MSAAWLVAGCSSPAVQTNAEHPTPSPAEAPLVSAQPGGWFDSHGNLTVVGAGRRLRLVLSAPISACGPAFSGGGAAVDVSTRASLPFHVLSEACRDTHPAILLPEESDTASPAELERSYHEVAHCAAVEWGLTEGWVPQVVDNSDPCPLALGLGWRLPTADELLALTVDDRKAIAGALFDTQDRTAFDGLLLYSRAGTGPIQLSTLSPNAAETAPTLTDDQRSRAFFGAALRCVRGGSATTTAPLPPLPHALECLREQRSLQGLTAVTAGSAAPVPDLQKLKNWLDLSQRTPGILRSPLQLDQLAQLLASPALEHLAGEAREERALTERYAELAEGLDDPSVSAGERDRRHAEFDQLRKRLGGQIVSSAETGSAGRTELAAVLSQLETTLELAAGQAKISKKSRVNYGPLIARVRELNAGKAARR